MVFTYMLSLPCCPLVCGGYVGGAVITLLYASTVHSWPALDVLVAYAFGSLCKKTFLVACLISSGLWQSHLKGRTFDQCKSSFCSAC